MDHRALDHALKAGGRLRIFARLDDKVLEFAVEILDQIALQFLDIDVAGAHDRRRVLVVEQCKQQMFERRIFVMAFIGLRQCAMQGIL
jgi:hypothetical protein